jgi:hypothetical protein
MGGDQRQQFSDFHPDKVNLPYQTEGDQTQTGYSDEHSRVMMEDQKKRRDDLMLALQRLGVMDQLAPSGMVPRIPYRPIEPTISF